jgi:hypothetical protein
MQKYVLHGRTALQLYLSCLFFVNTPTAAAVCVCLLNTQAMYVTHMSVPPLSCGTETYTDKHVSFVNKDKN